MRIFAGATNMPVMKMLKEYAKTYGFEDGDAMEKAYSKDTLKEAMLTDLVKDWLVDNCIQKTDN